MQTNQTIPRPGGLPSRRRFIQGLGASLTLAGTALAAPPAKRSARTVFVASDLHIGNANDGLDGADSFALALDDLRHNLAPISYGLILGDISHSGDRASLQKYLALRDASAIPLWFELAGNHDHRNNGIGNFTALIHSIQPRLFLDGNVAWIFLSDEKDSRQGDLSEPTLSWLEETLASLDDKSLIVCSHQLVANTVKRSEDDENCLHPKSKVASLLNRFPIDLWLCGHEHHGPYSREHFIRKEQTTFINVASMSRVYKTGKSESFILELTDGAREIVARRRDHENARYEEEFEVRIPLRIPLRCAPNTGQP